MRIHYQFLAALVAAVALVLGGCDRREGAATQPPPEAGAGAEGQGKPLIVASIYPLGNLVEELAYGWADVETLLPPGESEHAYEFTPAQIARLGEADLVVVVGMGLDQAVEDTATRVRPGVPLVRFADLVQTGPSATGTSAPALGAGAATAAADVHDHAGHDHADHDQHDHAGHDHAADSHEADGEAGHDGHTHAGHAHAAGGPNPHLWLDPILTARFVQALGPKLEPLAPDEDHRRSLRHRVTLLLANLGNLHQTYQAQVSRMPEKRLVTFHNAFDPLAQRYGLQVVAHLSDPDLTPGGEVTPGRLREVIDAVKRHNLRVIYAEPQLPDRAAQAIAEATGVKVLKLDPLGHPHEPGYTTYLEMMRSNLDTLVDGQFADSDNHE